MKVKSILIAVLFMAISASAFSQTATPEKPTLYHPDANAKKEIAEAVMKAKKENKNVLLQIGGNWCVWCLRFNKLVTEDTTLNKLMNDNYVVVHVNYSKENKNEDVLASLGYPQRFGFPVFVVLDQNGKRLNTQNSGYLENGKGGHDPEKVAEFLKGWTPAAINPSTYQTK